MKNFSRNSNDKVDAKRRGGVTLIELLVVITILGIMSAVAVPRYFNAMEQYKADAAAKRVLSDLVTAQRNALTTSTNRTVTFTVASDSYSLSGIADRNHPGASYAVDLDETGYSASLVSANFGGSAVVTFNRYGRPDNGGTVVVQSGSYQKTISVDAVTGRVTIL